MRFEVVVLRAVIWSSTSFWSASAWATITAVRSADDGRRRRPLDALDQLEVVAADDVEREVALDADRELGEQVLVLLADGEQHVLLEDAAPGRGRSPRATRSSPSRAASRLLRPGSSYWRSRPIAAQRLAFSCSIDGVVALELVLALVEGGDDRIDVVLAGAVLVEVVAHPAARRRTGGFRAACVGLSRSPCVDGSRSSI